MKRLLITSALAAFTLITPSLHAQAAHGFRPGQTISWQDRISGKWQSGTYVGATPGDKQPIIQQRPGEPGSQTAYDWDKISQTPPPAAAAAPAAGGKGMKPGQKIRWKDRITGQWQEGEFVGETPGGKQPIILQRPGDVGSQTAFDWDNVQDGNAAAPGAAPANAPAIPPLPMANPNPAQPPAANNPPAPAAQPPMNNPANNPQAPTAAGVGPNGPPLTEDEVLSYMRQQLGPNKQNAQQANKDLGALVKARGTNFMYLYGRVMDNPASTFPTEISALMLNSDASGPLSHNYGPPNTKEQLFGTWDTNTIGLPTHTYEEDKRITHLELAQAKSGTVTIEPGNHYRWQSASGLIEGTWRDAMPDEMGDQGGAGIILENAKDGKKWVAYKYRAATAHEYLGLAEVDNRNMRMSATRAQ